MTGARKEGGFLFSKGVKRSKKKAVRSSLEKEILSVEEAIANEGKRGTKSRRWTLPPSQLFRLLFIRKKTKQLGKMRGEPKTRSAALLVEIVTHLDCRKRGEGEVGEEMRGRIEGGG